MLASRPPSVSPVPVTPFRPALLTSSGPLSSLQLMGFPPTHPYSTALVALLSLCPLPGPCGSLTGFSLFFTPALLSSLADIPGHVQSADYVQSSFSLCSRFVPEALAVLCPTSTMRTFPLTMSSLYTITSRALTKQAAEVCQTTVTEGPVIRVVKIKVGTFLD